MIKDYTKDSIYEECFSFLQDQSKNIDPNQKIILDFMIGRINALYNDMGYREWFDPSPEYSDSQRELDMIRIRDLAYGMMIQGQYFAVVKWCWFSHFCVPFKLADEFIRIGNLALYMGKETGDTQTVLLDGVYTVNRN